MHKTILFLVFIFSIGVTCMAQNKERPKFPGGTDELYKYLKSQVEQTKPTSVEKINGSVTVLFDVDTQGRVQNPIVGLSLAPTCDSLALQIVKKCPLGFLENKIRKRL